MTADTTHARQPAATTGRFGQDRAGFGPDTAATRPPISMLAAHTAIAVVASLAVNLVIRAITVGATEVPEGFLPLQIGPLITLTVAPLVAAGLWATLLWRVTSHARTVFTVSAVALFAASMFPVLSLPGATEPELVGATTGHLVGLSLMHLTPTVITLATLARVLGRRPR